MSGMDLVRCPGRRTALRDALLLALLSLLAWAWALREGFAAGWVVVSVVGTVLAALLGYGAAVLWRGYVGVVDDRLLVRSGVVRCHVVPLDGLVRLAIEPPSSVVSTRWRLLISRGDQVVALDERMLTSEDVVRLLGPWAAVSVDDFTAARPVVRASNLARVIESEANACGSDVDGSSAAA